MDEEKTMELEYLSEDYAVRAQIAPEDLEALKAQGFKSVFCHRPDHEDEGQPEFAAIAEAAKALGLDAQHLPVIPNEISEGDHAAFKAMLDAAPKPVLAYCKTGGRAKVLWNNANTA